MTQNELYHHGIKGQRWGIRRYQNPDGSLTTAGRRKQAKAQAKAIQKEAKARVKAIKEQKKNQAIVEKAENKANLKISKAMSDSKSSESKPKSIKDMSDDEIRNKINRIKLERELQSLTPKEVSKGKQFVDSLAKDVITPAAKNVGRQYLEKTMKDLMGLNEKQTKDSFDALKKEVDTLELKKRKAVAEDYLNKRKEKQESESQNKQSSKKNDKTSDNSSKKDDKTSSDNSSKNEDKVYSETVEGEGTSKRTTDSSSKRKQYTDEDVVDADYHDITNDERTLIGRDYINTLLLEDKKRKK